MRENAKESKGICRLAYKEDNLERVGRRANRRGLQKDAVQEERIKARLESVV
jgi:hypothetical protein